VRRGPITVTWLAGDPAEPPRVAYAIGRKAGGAVVRNRIRRRLRAITREVGAQLRPGAYLFGANAAAASLSYGDLRATVCHALGALHRRP
jgi:ribonuclease P protein component